MEQSANLRVVITDPPGPEGKVKVADLDILLNGGVATKTAALSVMLVDAETGDTIPALPFCPTSRADAIKFYRNSLGAAAVAASSAIQVLSTGPADQALDNALDQTNKILGLNPDPTTPSDSTELMEAVGGIGRTQDREQLERRAGQVFDVNIVAGVLFPPGSADLTGLRAAAAALDLAGTCDLTPLSGEDPFFLVTTQTTTTETVVSSTCGEDVVDVEAVERPIGTDITTGQAAGIAGIEEEALGLRLFWRGPPVTTVPVLQRMRALGLTTEEISAALQVGSAGRLTSAQLDTSIVTSLLERLSEAEVCQLLDRPDTGPIEPNPTPDQVAGAITSLQNSNTGNRNRAGTDQDAIESGRAGRTGDPTLFTLGLVNLPRSFNVAQQDPDPGLSPDCQDILNVVNDSIAQVEGVLEEARAFTQELLGGLALGQAELSTAQEFSSCLVSFNAALSIELSLGLPFLMEAFLAEFTALTGSFISAATTIRAVLCIPQGVIQLLFGGVCGFSPFDFTICPPDIQALVERLINMLTIALTLFTKLATALLTMQTDISAIGDLTAGFREFSACGTAATPIGISLGLAGG